MKELDIISCIKNLSPSNDTIIHGIDDDAAVIKAPLGKGLVCSDMLMDGVHFRLQEHEPKRIGHKALAVNLSDIAAMGGKAESAYISLALPQEYCQPSFISSLYEGLGELAKYFSVAIAGGDTNIWKGPFVISVTVVGVCHARGPVLRSGARPGDAIFITGPLGGSIEGHHLDFLPRLNEAKALMDNFHLTSMIDISDGLGKDLRQITNQSKVGAILQEAAIPLRPTKGPNSLDKAMNDGEDFELCFTLSEDQARQLEADPRFAFCQRIGRIIEDQVLLWENSRQAIEAFGYEHGRGT